MDISNMMLLWADLPTDIAFGSFTIGQIATYGIWLVLALLAITAFIAFVGPAIYTALNITDTWKGIVSLLVVIALAALAYMISTGQRLLPYAIENDLTLTHSRAIDAVMLLFAILWFYGRHCLFVTNFLFGNHHYRL